MSDKSVFQKDRWIGQEILNGERLGFYQQCGRECNNNYGGQ